MSTINQWLIFLRKIEPFKLNLQGDKHYLLSLNMGPVTTLFVNRKFNNSLKVLAFVQILANIKTPGLAQYHLE